MTRFYGFVGLCWLLACDAAAAVELLFLKPGGALGPSAALNWAIAIGCFGFPLLHVIALIARKSTLELVTGIVLCVGSCCVWAFTSFHPVMVGLTLVGCCVLMAGWYAGSDGVAAVS